VSSGTYGSMRIRAAVVAVLVLSAGTASAEGPCLRAAKVVGEPALRQSVIDELDAREVPVAHEAPIAAGGRCGKLEAEVADEGDRVRVTIHLDDGRRVERTAADAEGAATIIESWSRRDVSDPLLAVRVAAEGDAVGSEPVDVGARGERAAARPGPARFELGAAVAGVVSGDGARWAGARGHACARVGAVCVGALLGYAKDTEQRGDSEALATERRAIDVLLAVELPIERGVLTVWPGIAVGESLVKIRTEADLDNLVGIGLVARIGAGVRVASAWKLRADLAVEAAPSATTRIIDPEGMDPDAAGAPRWLGWLGVGLSYGAP